MVQNKSGNILPERIATKLRQGPLAPLMVLGASGLIILLGGLFNGFRGGYFKIPAAKWIDLFVEWLMNNFKAVFDIIKVSIALVLNNFEKFLLWLPWWSVIFLVLLFSIWLAGLRIAIFSVAGMYLILLLGLWDLSMITLALMAVSVVISNVVGIPLGILAAKSDRFEKSIRPLLDAMQVMPSFVYLIPALMFFGIGRVPAVMACVIYALPPVVRLTNLGIRQVPTELVEAAHAFGSTQLQLLLKVELPVALPSIMAGVNQTIMMNLGMAVLAAMIAAGGLGREVLMALGQIDIGRGFVAGFCIVILAMVLDRITQVLGHKKKKKRAE
jgi:glycine betaine/proline transport system permease protein